MSHLSNANSSLVRLKSWTSKIPLVLLVGLFIGHFMVIEKYAVDVPFIDEWHMLDPDGLPAGLSFKWLFAQFNEHKIATTKLLIWVLFQFDGWNLVTHQLLNFILYGLLLLFIAWLAKKWVPQLVPWVICSFLIFLLSPVNHENHAWGFQSQIHLSLLFFLAAVYFLFDEAQKTPALLSGTAMAVLAMYSFLGGLVSCLVLLVIFCCFKLTRVFSCPERGKRQRELLQLLLVLMPALGAVVLWFSDYHQLSHRPPLVLPQTLLFWTYFIKLVSFGFGFQEMRARWGIVCLLIVLAPVAGEIWKKQWRLPSSSWAIFAAIMGILAVLAGITAGRAGMYGPENHLIRSSYLESGMMLIPLTVLSWSRFLSDRPKLKGCVIAALWVFCFLGFWSHWRPFHYYENMAQRKLEGLECVKHYYAQGGDAYCTAIQQHGPIAVQLEQAKKLNLSFYTKIPKETEPLKLSPMGATDTGRNEQPR